MIADYKGRLLYTSAAPTVWGADLTVLAAVKRALDTGKGDSVTVLPYADPGLASTGVLGSATKRGLAVLFERTVALGDKASGASEARALYLQLQDGKQLLDDVRLDDQTLLALVAPDGTSIADDHMPAALVASRTRDAIVERDGGRSWLSGAIAPGSRPRGPGHDRVCRDGAPDGRRSRAISGSANGLRDHGARGVGARWCDVLARTNDHRCANLKRSSHESATRVRVFLRMA